MRDVLAIFRKYLSQAKKSLMYLGIGFILDLLIAKEYIYITAGNPLLAALVSGLITLISVFVISKVVRNETGGAMLSYATGNALGTYFAI